jgi:hypothetical protein
MSRSQLCVKLSESNSLTSAGSVIRATSELAFESPTPLPAPLPDMQRIVRRTGYVCAGVKAKLARLGTRIRPALSGQTRIIERILMVEE